MTDLKNALDSHDKFMKDGFGETDPVIIDAARRWVAVQEAMTNKGPHPEFHDAVMHRHKAEWPTLWVALTPPGDTE